MPSIAIPHVHLSFGRYLLLAGRFTLRTQPGMFLLVFPVLTVVLFIVQLLQDPPPLTELFAPERLLFWFMLVALGLTPVQMWQRYRRTPLLSGTTSYELSDAGLYIEAPDQRLRLSWPGIRRGYLFGWWLLLMADEQKGFFVDLRQVQDPYEADQVLHLLQHHGVDLR